MGIKYFGKHAVMLACVLMASLVVGVAPVAASSTSTTTLVTVGDEGEGANDSPLEQVTHSTTPDGDIVVFSTQASNLVADDTNEFSDVFLHNKTTGQTERISTNTDGGSANGYSVNPSISNDGRYVVYATTARNIIPISKASCLAQSPCTNIIVHDRVTGQNSFANLNDSGERIRASIDVPPVISGDGNSVAFQSISSISPNDSNGAGDILVRNLQTQETSVVSVDPQGATGQVLSSNPALSDGGRLVAFNTASQLASNDDNGGEDVYVHDRQTGITTLVSPNYNGLAANWESYKPAISGNGQAVAFVSIAEDLVPGDTNEKADIFVRDLQTSTTSRVSNAVDGSQSDEDSYEADISADGNTVAFASSATNLVADDVNGVQDVFLRDRSGATTTQVSVGSYDGPAAEGGDSFRPAISSDGKTVAFLSEATNLHPTSLTPGVPNLYLFHEPVTTP